MKIKAMIIRYCKMEHFHDNLFIITGNGKVMSSTKCFISLDVYNIVRLMTHWPLIEETVILNQWFSHSYQGVIYIENFLWKCLQENATRLHWWLVNIGWGIGLVPSDNKPVPESMFNKFYDVTSRP